MEYEVAYMSWNALCKYKVYLLPLYWNARAVLPMMLFTLPLLNIHKGEKKEIYLLNNVNFILRLLIIHPSE